MPRVCSCTLIASRCCFSAAALSFLFSSMLSSAMRCKASLLRRSVNLATTGVREKKRVEVAGKPGKVLKLGLSNKAGSLVGADTV